jgi:two-component sensor histidine kinase
LQDALDHQKVLLGEISHRVKNSLQLVASMFMLQADATKDETLARGLRDAVSRVTAVARVHERLYRTAEIGTVDLSAYLGEVCAGLSSIVEPSAIRYTADGPISMSTDRAIRVALLATELVTNAARHAYARSGGEIRVALTRTAAHPETVSLSVRDDGVGLPAEFDITRGGGLGTRLIGSLVAQMGANVAIRRHNPGSEFVIALPIHAATASA